MQCKRLWSASVHPLKKAEWIKTVPHHSIQIYNWAKSRTSNGRGGGEQLDIADKKVVNSNNSFKIVVIDESLFWVYILQWFLQFGSLNFYNT